MFVLFDNIEGSQNRYKVIAVYPTEPKSWTRDTQIGLEIDNSTNANVTVPTPDGDMLLLEALMQRSGAFTYDPASGGLIHDDNLVVEL